MVILVAFIFLVVLYIPVALIVEKKVDFSCGWDRYGDDYALNFAAHYSNNVYGNSSSVSVPAAYSLIIIRT